MARMTIAQLREQEVLRLAQYHSDDPTDADMREAARLMNSFYRLCGLSERNLYLANDERTCNLASTEASEKREHAWYERLCKEFEAFSGLTLFYTGYAPSIGIIVEHGGVSEKITRWFYC